MSGRGPGLPEWVPFIQTARWLRVPPWELAEQPYYWYEWASTVMEAEAAAAAAEEKKRR